jgi:hypothetical protein
MILRALATVALLFGSVPPCWPQEPGEAGDARAGSASVAVDVGSRYVWRGIRLSAGIVSQLAIDAEWRGLGVGVWSNYDPRENPIDSGSRRRVTETDLTVSYARAWGRGTLTGGAIYYGLRDSSDTSELFLAYQLDAPLAPSATLFLDVDEGDGAFLLLGAAHPVALTDAVSLEAGVEAGLNLGNALVASDEEGRSFAGPYHAEVWAGTSIPIGGRLALVSRLALTFPLGRRAADAIAASSYDGLTRTCAYGSVGMTLAF